MKDTFAIIATVLAVLGYGPYLLKTISKQVSPHPYTWFVWSIISGITLFGQIAKGAGIGALPTTVAEILTIVIFGFSLRNGFTYVHKSDTYYLIAALVGLIPWLIFRDPTITVVIAVTVDVIAFTPTFRKTWEHPGSETRSVYFCNVVRHAFTLSSLRTYNVATMLHSIAMILTNGLVTLILWQSRSRRAEKKRISSS